MKFVCERCHTRYSIADEKVRQKILKIRCKTCENVITVRDSALAPIPGGAVSAPSRSMNASRAAAPRSTTVPPLAPTVAEWYVAVNGAQNGPVTRADAAKRALAAAPGDEVYVWKEDLDSWKDPKDVPAIAQEMAAQRGRTSAPPPRPPSMPSLPVPAGLRSIASGNGAAATGAAAAPVFARGSAAPKLAAAPMFEEEEEEHTQIQALDASLLADEPAKRSGAPSRSRSSLAAAPSATPSPSSSSASPFAGLAAAPASAGASISALFSSVPATGPVPATAPGDGLSKLVKLPGSPVMKYAAAGLIVVAVLVGVVLTTMDKPAEVAAPATPAEVPPTSVQPPPVLDESQIRAEADRRFKRTVSVGPDKTPPRRVIGMAKAHAKTPLQPAKPAQAVEPAPLTPEQELASRRFAQNERRVTGYTPQRANLGGGGSAAEVSQGQISAVVKRKDHQDAIKMCYERALKRDDRLRNGRVEVTVSIGQSGIVKQVSVNGPAEFSSVETCIRQSVKRWMFPRSNDEYGTTFPLIFQGSL